MRKYLLVLFFSLSFIQSAICAPSNSMSITPTASDGTTITASDENTRNNEVSTKFNAHDHNDIDQTANTVSLGDATAGNKEIQANNADSNKPFFRYDDTNNRWIISENGTVTASLVTLTGVEIFYKLPGSMVQGDVIYADASSLGRLAAGTKGQAMTTGGASANPSWAGMTTQGDVEYHNGTTRTRLAAGTSGQFLKTQGAGANPIWDNAGANMKVGSFTRDISTATGSQAVTGVGFVPTAIMFIGGTSTAIGRTTYGFSATGIHESTYDQSAITANQWDVDTDSSIHTASTSGNFYEGTVASFDSDGFTVSWTKTGTPTGTLTMFYLAIK